jgi:hypothetical protein
MSGAVSADRRVLMLGASAEDWRRTAGRSSSGRQHWTRLKALPQSSHWAHPLGPSDGVPSGCLRTAPLLSTVTGSRLLTLVSSCARRSRQHRSAPRATSTIRRPSLCRQARAHSADAVPRPLPSRMGSSRASGRKRSLGGKAARRWRGMGPGTPAACLLLRSQPRRLSVRWRPGDHWLRRRGRRRLRRC